MPTEYPYPQPFEIIRFISRALDLKQSKRLDDLAGKIHYDPRELSFFIHGNLHPTIKKYMGSDVADLMSVSFDKYLDNYMVEVVGRVSADETCREMVLKILMRNSVKDYFLELMLELHSKIGGPDPILWFSSSGSAVKKVLLWINRNSPVWQDYISGVDKGRKDMISSWSRAEGLPSAQSILLLGSNPVNIDWHKIKTLLFVARAIDFIKNEPLGLVLINEARLSNWGVEETQSMESEMAQNQKNVLYSVSHMHNLIAKIQHDLRRTVKKNEPHYYRNLIDHARDQAKTSTKLNSFTYWIDWHDARWNIFTGDLRNANELYKSAFENAIFCAGDNQRLIIEEAIVVAASLPNPDRVFLKHLKWALINFGYDIPSISTKEPSQIVRDTIEEWELDLWKGSFSRCFPKVGLFPGVEYKDKKVQAGPLVFDENFSARPDYRNLNRKIKVGEMLQRNMPQLVWFTLIEDIKTCQALIDKGAKVDVSSEGGETPILTALEALNVTHVNKNSFIGLGPLYKSLNDDLFNLFMKLPHKPCTLNIRTERERLLPIISAVQSGRYNVVQAVLKMGAKPNVRGLTDEQTALNVCLKIIGILKDPELSIKTQSATPITPELFDSIRRHANGTTGFTMAQQEKVYQELKDSGLYQYISSFILESRNNNIISHMTIYEMRRIAKLLIEAGADVNAEHASPIKGYTPLMLAVELDESELFDAMIEAGGDVQKTYKNPRNGYDVSVTQIAKYFGAFEILKTLAR